LPSTGTPRAAALKVGAVDPEPDGPEPVAAGPDGPAVPVEPVPVELLPVELLPDGLLLPDEGPLPAPAA
jgi:hypothetical protein